MVPIRDERKDCRTQPANISAAAGPRSKLRSLIPRCVASRRVASRPTNSIFADALTLSDSAIWWRLNLASFISSSIFSSSSAFTSNIIMINISIDCQIECTGCSNPCRFAIRAAASPLYRTGHTIETCSVRACMHACFHAPEARLHWSHSFHAHFSDASDASVVSRLPERSCESFTAFLVSGLPPGHARKHAGGHIMKLDGSPESMSDPSARRRIYKNRRGRTDDPRSACVLLHSFTVCGTRREQLERASTCRPCMTWPAPTSFRPSASCIPCKA